MLTLPRTLNLTPSQFAEVCAANPEAVLELAADGTLIEMTPTGVSTGVRNQTLGALLWLAIEQSRLPLKLFDSSATPATSKVVRPVRPKAHLGRCLAGGVPASAAAQPVLRCRQARGQGLPRGVRRRPPAPPTVC